MKARARTVAGVAAATLVGAVLAGVLGGVSAVSTLDAHVGLVVRAALVTAVLLVVPALVVRRRLLSDRRSVLVTSGVVGLVLAYVLDPFAWGGRAYVAQLVLDPGAAAVAVDLLAWLTLGTAGVWAATRSAVRSDEPVGYRS